MIVVVVVITSASHVGAVIKSFALKISFIYQSQSSTEQRVRMEMLLTSSLKMADKDCSAAPAEG